jgi:glucosamine--fructose-6-phosphate aminotransferase (isomerizing)
MCGIAGYIGKENATATIFEMLKRLEYRGYDSAGIAYIGDQLEVIKDEGKVDTVRSKAEVIQGPKTAIGHSRWATHGPPSQENAHPHTDGDEEIAIVHNGIIENYMELQKELGKKGIEFRSQTDSETIVHLIHEGLKENDFETAFHKAVKKLEGSFALLAVYEKEPDKILFARNESPLLVGVGKGENFLASDMPAILPETRNAIILDDMEYGILRKDKVIVKSIETGKEIKKKIHKSDLSIEAAEKGGHEHFMIKEILEESAAVSNALRSRVLATKIAKQVKDCRSVYLVACGTAWHAGVAAKYMLQEYGVPAMAEVASEFRYSTVSALGKEDLVILISQSGETADTLAAAKAAKAKGAKTVAVVNVVGSSLTRVAEESIYTYSGPEIAVASTKVYLGQLTSLTLLVLELLSLKGKISSNELKEIYEELDCLPAKIDIILDNRERISDLAHILKETNDYFYIARRLNYPTAMEGALKLKEISYLHAEAYAGGELKHGPLALMEPKVCVVAINPDDALKKKMDSNIQEIRSRKAKIIEVIEGDNFNVENGGDIKLSVPRTHKILTPLTTVVPLHLLSYYVALAKGLNIDKPRNLAKSVTVE